MAATLRIELSYPAAALSPNARVHHMALWRAKRDAKIEATWATKAAIGRDKFAGGENIPVTITAHPILGKERKDDDNMAASCKAALDGVAAALGVNDKHFRIAAIQWAEPIARGRLIVEVGQ